MFITWQKGITCPKWLMVEILSIFWDGRLCNRVVSAGIVRCSGVVCSTSINTSVLSKQVNLHSASYATLKIMKIQLIIYSKIDRNILLRKYGTVLQEKWYTIHHKASTRKQQTDQRYALIYLHIGLIGGREPVRCMRESDVSCHKR